MLDFIHEEPYKFIGQNGSMGLATGKIYRIRKYENGPHVVVEWRVNGIATTRCPYISERTFAGNWERQPCERRECVEARAELAEANQRAERAEDELGDMQEDSALKDEQLRGLALELQEAEKEAREARAIILILREHTVIDSGLTQEQRDAILAMLKQARAEREEEAK